MKLIIMCIMVTIITACTVVAINGDNNNLSDQSREGGILIDK